MKENLLQGGRYICLVRCSTNDQAQTSLPDQITLLHAYGDQRGMIHAGADVVLDGVSGSKPGARSDLDAIVSRKRQQNDFDYLLVQDMSRLTRGGVEHGAKIEFDLNAAGIQLIFASGSLPDGDHAGIIKSVEYYSAQQYAKSVSFAVARGQMSAVLEGRMAHCLRPPYGIDRLYLSLDGRPLHVIRNLTDASQQKLDPATGALLETYAADAHGRSTLHYRKQKSERVSLVPGAPVQIAIVRQMFRHRLIDGWGHWRIAKELNDQGVPSPNGKPWSQQTIKLLLRNPVYTGTGIGNRRTHSLYHTRSTNQPTRAPMNRQDWATRKQPKTRYRPRSEWVEQAHPALTDYLGDDLRERAITYQATFLTGPPTAAPARADKHIDSAFILKGILKSKQGGHPMTGRTQGSKEKPYRYYHVSTACRIPSSDGTMRRLVPAEPIEQAVLNAVRTLLLQADQLRPRIEAAIQAQMASADKDNTDLTALRDQRHKLQQQVEFVIEELSAIGKDAAKNKIGQIETQLANLDDRIARAGKPGKAGSIDLTAVVDRIIVQLGDAATRFDEMPPRAIRTFLGTVIEKLEVDLVTRQAEIALRLPDWAFKPEKSVEALVGLDEKFLQRALVETQAASGLTKRFSWRPLDEHQKQFPSSASDEPTQDLKP